MNSKYYISAFVAGFSLMTVELASSRIIAPIIGSSIFTWTSVIGTILFGLTIGNLIGGKIADNYTKIFNGEKILSLSMLLSMFFVYLIIPLSKNIDFILDKGFSIMWLSVIICTILFLLPSIAIGTISPIIFNLYVNDIKNIGRKYGLLSGLWSLGSILGVFMTGFYFISKIGSSGTIYFISIIFLILFFFFYIKNIKKDSAYLKREIGFVVFILIIFLVSIFSRIQKDDTTSSKIVYQKETGYYMAKVVDYDYYDQYGKNRWLFLDIDSHSVRTEKPTQILYTDIHPAFSAFSNKIENIHVIGAGAYSLPINLRKIYPKSNITVSEIDPEVEKIAKEYFDLEKYNIKTEITDARMKFAGRKANKKGDSEKSEKYDLIYGDAYNSFISVPWHLLTKEFIGEIKNSLNQNGIYAINFIGAVEGKDSKMFESVYSTINETFPNNYVFTFGDKKSSIQSITIFGINNDKYIDRVVLLKKLAKIDPSLFLSKLLLDKETVNVGRGIGKGIILTDNYSPIEYMMRGIMDKYFIKYYSVYRKITG